MNIRSSLTRISDQDSPPSLFSRTKIDPILRRFHPFGWNSCKYRSQSGQDTAMSASALANHLDTPHRLGQSSNRPRVIYDDHFDAAAKYVKFESLRQAKAKLKFAKEVEALKVNIRPLQSRPTIETFPATRVATCVGFAGVEGPFVPCFKRSQHKFVSCRNRPRSPNWHMTTRPCLTVRPPSGLGESFLAVLD